MVAAGSLDSMNLSQNGYGSKINDGDRKLSKTHQARIGRISEVRNLHVGFPRFAAGIKHENSDLKNTSKRKHVPSAQSPPTESN